MSDVVVRWAYSAYLAAEEQGIRAPGSWAVGERLMRRLEATVSEVDPDDSPGPRTPHATLPGYALRVDETLAPDEWRMDDLDGNVLVTGVFDAHP